VAEYATGASLGLALVLFLSASAKASNPSNFATALWTLLPRNTWRVPLANPLRLARFLIVYEVGLGCVLVAARGRVAIAAADAAFLTFFGFLYPLRRAELLKKPCGCHRHAGRPTDAWDFASGVGLAMLAAALLISRSGTEEFVWHPGALSGASLVMVMALWLPRMRLSSDDLGRRRWRLATTTILPDAGAGLSRRSLLARAMKLAALPLAIGGVPALARPLRAYACSCCIYCATSPNPSNTGQTVTLNGCLQATQPVGVTVVWGDGQADAGGPPSGCIGNCCFSFNHVYNAPGRYTIQVYADQPVPNQSTCQQTVNGSNQAICLNQFIGCLECCIIKRKRNLSCGDCCEICWNKCRSNPATGCLGGVDCFCCWPNP
jgi:hypothetical protein